jgi:hypothetical protein
VLGSAEGATAPETLRQKDRSHVFNSEELLAHSSASAPKEQAIRNLRLVNLSGQETEGAL